MGLSIPSTLLLILIGLFGAFSHQPAYYLTQAETQAVSWIQAHTDPGALVLASPDMGHFIPGLTGRRVVYGHPFETINADQEKEWVNAFYQESGPANLALLSGHRINYLVFGPREQALGGKIDLSGLQKVFQSGSVQIFAIPESQ